LIGLLRRWKTACGLSALVLMMVIGCVCAAAPVKVYMIEFARTDEAEWQRAVVERFHASQDDIQIELISLAGSSVSTKPLVTSHQVV